MKLSFSEQKTTWQTIKTNWLIRSVTNIVFIINVFSILYILIRLPNLPPLVPLWYSRPWGADQLASPLWLFVLPVGSILLYVVNLAIVLYLTKEYLVFTQIIFLTSLLVSLLTCMTLIKILALVT